MDKDRLKKVVKDFYNDYRLANDEGEKEYRATLPVGSKVLPLNKIYGAERRARFDERAREARAAAEAVFSAELREIGEQKTQAPDTGAAAVVAMMKGRENVSSDELLSLLDRYGDNYLTHGALSDIAAKNGIRGVDKHPLDIRLEALENLQSSVNRALTTIDAERHGSSGFQSFLDSMIDEY